MTATIDCPRCRQTLSSDAQFCGSCGLSTALISAESELSKRFGTNDNENADPLVGHVLDSKYQLVERLGAGAMGAVYRARRLHIGDEVAVKVLHQEFVVDARSIERFRREARSAAVISHANVVAIHDFGESKAESAPAYIVMELVRGPSLRVLLKQEGCLKPGRAVALMQNICAGVGVAHRQGIVHRDLKPDNVVIVPPAVEGDREVAKVVDFGIAKLRDLAAEFRLTQTGALMGTPYYMSPEQCRGEQLDARADVYSLGAMLYEMLSGTAPFKAESLAGVITKHLYEAPPALAKDLGVPPELEAVCCRALAKSPAERPADATVLNRELQASLGTSGVNTVPSSPLYESPAGLVSSSDEAPLRITPGVRISKWAMWAVAGLFSLLIGVVAVVGVVIFLERRGPADRGAGAANVNSNSDQSQTPGVNQSPQVDQGSKEESKNTSEEKSPELKGAGLTGTWTGTYGPASQPAKMMIKENQDGEFSGVLEQGGVSVAFVGTVDKRKVTLKETQVLSGDGWSLGENTGEISDNGRKMSGTGKDAIGGQFGISYNWSFVRQ